MKDLKSRILKEESGFTLSEMMVTILVMLTVLYALYSIFDMSLRVFSFGNDKIEAIENARVALERMEREIRGAFPYDAPTDTRVLYGPGTSATQITFYNDLNGDGKGNGTNEVISFYVDANGNLMRRQGSNAPEPLTALGPGGALEFKYFHKETGAEITSPATDEANVGMVRVKVVVIEEGVQQDPRQELITNVFLRNRE
jgi:prepilin-type N-terminal cleavage/methylation domain-containing protein